MLNQVIDRFESEFGRQKKATRKVVAWEPRLDVGVVLEREEAKPRGHAWVWVPHPGPNADIPGNAVEYDRDKGRHSNTYSLPGLRKGMPALRFRIEKLSQLDELIAFIRGLPPIRGVA